MADTEGLPSKRRKIEEVIEHNGEGSSSTGRENELKSPSIKSSVNFHIKPNAIARLRQITTLGLSPQKQTDQQKSDPKVTMGTMDLHDKNKNDSETGDSKSKENVTTGTGVNGDVIISSTGSSPAHSPKPEDLVVLSTPPKKPSAEKANHIEDNISKVCKKLTDQFDQSDEQKKTNEHLLKEKKIEPVVIIEKEDPKPTEVKPEDIPEPKPSTAAAVAAPLSLDTAELKKVLKVMIDEKFKQVEGIYQNQESENELRERIARLEDENRGLQEYAAKLEKAVKLLLSNQKNKKDSENQSSQTDDVVLPAVSTTKSITPTSISAPVVHKPAPAKPPPIPKVTSPTVTPATQIPQLINQINKPGSTTMVTSRLTSTQAAIPGHSVTPASLPQRATYSQQQVRVTSPVTQVTQGQRLTHPSNVTMLRPTTPQVTSPTRRPAPVTVTVHPQSTTTTMLTSPSYTTQMQKSTYVTNTITAQPSQQFAAQRPRPPILLQQQAPVQSMANSQPKVVYQRPPAQQASQPVQQYSNSVAMRSPPGTQIVGHQTMNSVTNQTRPPQNPTGSFQQTRPPMIISPTRPQVPMIISPRGQAVANHDQSNNYQLKDQPGRPIVSIAVVSNGIVLSWNMQNPQSSSRIVRYQLFALQDVGSNTAQWKKIGVVNALPLPMACTLTQFMPGNKYHFTVRAQDEHGRCGPLSEPCTVTLT